MSRLLPKSNAGPVRNWTLSLPARESPPGLLTRTPPRAARAPSLVPRFLMAIFSLYVGAFLMGLFREAFTTLPRCLWMG